MTTEFSDSLRARIVAEYAKGHSIEMVGRLLNLSYHEVRDALHVAHHAIRKHGDGWKHRDPGSAIYGRRWSAALPSSKEDELSALYGEQHYADDSQACEAEPRFRGVPAQHE